MSARISYNADIPLSIRTKHLHSVLSTSSDGDGDKDHKHNITNEQFRLALENVNDPIVVTKDNAGRLAALTEIKDSSGNNILCSFEIDGKTKNFLLTMYGKKLTTHYFENKKVVYINKKIGNSSSLDRSNPDRIYEDVSKYTIGQSNTDVKSVEYNLSKPEEVDRFLLDAAKGLTEGFNNQDEHWEIQPDKSLVQRLKDLDLATNADRDVAKKYLADYYKNLKVTYTNKDLNGKKYTYSLGELLTSEERKALSEEIGNALGELAQSKGPTKNEKVIEALNLAIGKYRERIKTIIAERKEANAKAENTRLLGNQIH